MKKFCLVLISSFLLLSGCDVASMSTLRDISKPYLGEYACEHLTLGDEEMLDKFDYVRLQLNYDNTFVLFYRDTLGTKGEYAGEYAFEEGGIRFHMTNGAKKETHLFRYEKGVIYVELLIGKKLLLAEFAC